MKVMTTGKLIAQLRVYDPAGTMPIIVQMDAPCHNVHVGNLTDVDLENDSDDGSRYIMLSPEVCDC